jgi:helix-hairpin-helix protein
MGNRARTAMSVAWALVPLFSGGIAAPLIFIHAAVRLRGIWHWIAVAVYLLLFIAVFANVEAPAGSTGDVIASAGIVLCWLGGTGHAFAIRSRVFAPRAHSGDVATRGYPQNPAPRGDFQNAVRAAEHRKEIRRQARDAARDPAVAWDLRIGRPDLPRGYDDGGLIDVNHVPAAALAALPGMTADLVDRIVRAREQCGGFVSVEELSALAQLPPELTPQLDEYTIYLP